MNSKQKYVRDALSALGIERLVLAIHDQSFPSAPDEETGRGSPYSGGGRQFVQFISDLGFNAIQLGPQGKTTEANPSPYDSSLFSKNDLSISLYSLVEQDTWHGLLTKDFIDAAIGQQSGTQKTTSNSPSHKQQPIPARSGNQDRNRAAYADAWQIQRRCLKQAHQEFHDRQSKSQDTQLSYVMWCRQNEAWLNRDSAFEVLSLEHGTDHWQTWPSEDQQLWIDLQGGEDSARSRMTDLHASRAADADFYNFCQFIVHKQHEEFRKLTNKLNMRIFADMQIGFSQRDMWALRPLFLPNYLLGAPPSRTNPDGQPWGYPVLNPDLYFDKSGTNGSTLGPALQWLTQRLDKLLQDYDGLRIDHPHGIVCPWVYDATQSNAMLAVQTGARLFESPDSTDHPGLARYAIAQRDQLSHSSEVARYADGWVTSLRPEQVEQYGVIIELIRGRMAAFGREPGDLTCEVLSSCPYPLKSVLAKYGLGRFRVTQKAKPRDNCDVYRLDNAQAADWVMVGTHDTKPIWRVVEDLSQGDVEAWAEYLAQRLQPDQSKRALFVQYLSASRTHLAEAMFADLFVGPAKNISIFFSDLLGIKEIYNEPGFVNDTNWFLSVPNNYAQLYAERTAGGQALNLPKVLSMALRAHPRLAESSEVAALIAKLEELAAAPALK